MPPFFKKADRKDDNMLILPIEKEIELDRKVILNLNMRQAVCGLGIIIDIFVFYSVAAGDQFLASILAAPLAILFGYLGWFSKNGLTPEEIAIRKWQSRYFKSNIRNYRTKNKYFKLMNEAMHSIQKEKEQNKPAVKSKSKEKPHKTVSQWKAY